MGAEHLQNAGEMAPFGRYTALCDINAEAVTERARDLGLPAFVDYRELVDSGLCDALLIATPHPFHAPVALYALTHGLHVLSEKPIAVAVSEADAMIEAARSRGLVLGVMFQERNRPIFRTTHQLLSSGLAGPLYRSVIIASHWFRTRPYYESGSWRGTWVGEGGGIIMNQAPHSLDTFIWLGGMPRQVTAQAFTRAQPIEAEDTVSALLDYGGGHTGYLYTTTAQWPGELRMEFSGELGQIVIDESGIRFFRLEMPLSDSLRDLPKFKRPAGEWEDVPLDGEDDGGHVEVVRRFVLAIRREGEPVADGHDGLRSLELANALLLSGYTGRPVDLPLDRTDYDRFLAEKRGQA
jgi:predicted dehydrogenase